MSLSAALNIARSALTVNQAAIQTVGNNIANVGNANYTRQTPIQSTALDSLVNGMRVGNGVQLDGIKRQIDEALQGRLRNSMSDSESAGAQQQWLSRVEAVFNELSDQDLSTQFSKFFNSWSDLANKPQDVGLRQVVLQQGQTVADQFHQMNQSVTSLQTELDKTVNGLANRADNLSNQLADLNVKIVQAESGGAASQANGLRDQRDTALKDLSNLMDVRTVEQPNGTMNVYVGSEPLVVNGNSRGVATRVVTAEDGSQVTKVVFKSNNGELSLESGQLGALGKVRDTLNSVADNVNQLAGSLAFELNKVHASGQGLQGVATVIGTTTLTDSTVALTDTKSGLRPSQMPSTGSFVVHVKDKATGLSTSTLVQVDLDGQGTDTSLDSLIAQLDNVDGITAANNGGRLQVSADNAPAQEISFSQDSSGVLASLGVGTFFSGNDARTINVNATLKDNPNLLAAAKNGNSGDNQTARAIANLETTALRSLNGQTLTGTYQSMVNTVAAQSSTASSNAEAASVVVETLSAQREAISGVSLDEEAVNLMRYQHAFQGAARVISVVDELMNTMLGLVR